MQCQICENKKTAPYKCPKCRMPYCSVTCFQKHQSSETCGEKSHQSKPVTETLVTQVQSPIELGDDEESDRISPHILERIGQSNEILELLKNRYLRALIKTVDGSINPADDMQRAMMDPMFVQFVDQLLLIAENKDIK